MHLCVWVQESVHFLVQGAGNKTSQKVSFIKHKQMYNYKTCLRGTKPLFKPTNAHLLLAHTHTTTAVEGGLELVLCFYISSVYEMG